MRVAVARNANLATDALGSLVPQTPTADPKAVAEESVPLPAQESTILR